MLKLLAKAILYLYWAIRAVFYGGFVVIAGTFFYQNVIVEGNWEPFIVAIIIFLIVFIIVYLIEWAQNTLKKEGY